MFDTEIADLRFMGESRSGKVEWHDGERRSQNECTSAHDGMFRCSMNVWRPADHIAAGQRLYGRGSGGRRPARNGWSAVKPRSRTLKFFRDEDKPPDIERWRNLKGNSLAGRRRRPPRCAQDAAHVVLHRHGGFAGLPVRRADPARDIGQKHLLGA
jgi:hypothetical protein